MRIPTVGNMIAYGFTREVALAVRKRCEECRIELQNTWHNKIAHPVKSAMSDIDIATKGYGVEYIPVGSNAKSPAIDYVNQGDAYATTIMFVNGNFTVGNWGSIVEKGNYE